MELNLTQGNELSGPQEEKLLLQYAQLGRQFTDLTEFFETLNHHHIQYAVLRNWEELPDSVELGAHSDLDLLVDDKDIMKMNGICRLANRNLQTWITQRLIWVGESYIKLDVRSLYDQYLPAQLAKDILSHRQAAKCFFIPRTREYFFSLLYHAAFQKPKIGPDYQEIFHKIALPDFDVARLHDGNYIQRYFQQYGYGLVEPFDPFVWWERHQEGV